MRFEFDYLEECHACRVTLSGVMRLPEYPAMVRAVLIEMAKYETTVLVIDLRNITLSLSFAETSSLPDLNLKLGVPLHYKVALIYLDYSVKANGVRFYEVIAANRGYYAQKLFTQYPIAIQWLTTPSSPIAQLDGIERNLPLRGLGRELAVMSD